MSEEEFIAQLKSGNQAAYKLCVEAYKDKVFNTAISILQDKDEADDTTQDVFVEVFQSISGFKGQAKLSTWLYRITITKCYEFLRRKKTKKRFGIIQSLFAPESGVLKYDKPDFYHPGVSMENKEKAAILFKAIDKLPANQRTAFVLHKVEGVSYAEIAEVMQVTLSSVESLIFRARQSLQKWLSDYYEENEK